eukprot:976621-Pelagomonas_calceolata.AAC.1
MGVARGASLQERRPAHAKGRTSCGSPSAQLAAHTTRTACCPHPVPRAHSPPSRKRRGIACKPSQSWRPSDAEPSCPCLVV